MFIIQELLVDFENNAIFVGSGNNLIKTNMTRKEIIREIIVSVLLFIFLGLLNVIICSVGRLTQ